MPLIRSDDKEQVDAWKEGIAFKAVWLLSVFPPRILGLELLEQSQSMLCQKWLKVEVVTLDR